MSSKFGVAASDATCKFSDFVSEPQGILPPIRGFEEKPLVSLEEAIKPLATLVPQIDHMVWTVKNTVRQLKDGLSLDESASIMLYTLQWSPPEKSFFDILNENLRRLIYRGVKLDFSKDYSEGQEFFWRAFSSCTSSLSVLENIIGKSGKRTLFNITFDSAKDISQHSFYPDEKEVLFYPARQFKVNSILNTGNDLHIIHVEETKPPFVFFEMPVTPKLNIDQFINILLIGEKGVGKSTFINAFANYLKFKTVEQAQTSGPIVIKPLSFRMMTNDTFEERTCTFGNFDHHDQSITSRCQTYQLDLYLNDGKKLCFIDTPSLEDTSDFDQDNTNNIKHILDYVNKLSHLNAICFLLQPDASRLFTSFQSCFSQLINRLGRNIRNNIIFCFTNALITFSMPGSTASLLRKMFQSHSMNDIPFSRDNTFFFENESFRYLVAVQNRARFDYEDEEEYKASWSTSVNE